jgi:hypothetical protein
MQRKPEPLSMHDPPFTKTGRKGGPPVHVVPPQARLSRFPKSGIFEDSFLCADDIDSRRKSDG